MTRLRPGRAEDAARCGDICYEAFRGIAARHGFPSDVPSAEMATAILSEMLNRENVRSILAEHDGLVVGSHFITFEDEIGGLGPLSIDPAHQDRSLGRRLMLRSVEIGEAAGMRSIRLVQAAWHCRSLALYTKLGFDSREPLSVMQGPAIGETLPGRRVRPAREADIPACNALCRSVHGHDRRHELAAGIARGGPAVVEFQGRITGYSTQVGSFGHSVAVALEDLQALIAAAPEFPGPGFLLPTRNSDLMRWCLARGLSIVEPMTLMTWGFYQEPQGPWLPSIQY